MIPTLDGIALYKNIAWIDEFVKSNVDYSDAHTLSGKLIRQRGIHSGGRPITLTGGPTTRATIIQLQTLQNTALPITLILQDGRTFLVDFVDGAGLEVKGIVDYPNPTNEDYYEMVLHLIEVV
jgi:hypothetical protein